LVFCLNRNSPYGLLQYKKQQGLDKAKEAARQWRAAEAWVYGFGVIPKKMNEVVMGLAKTKEIRKGE
jgi:hypothetical protein